LIRVRASLQAIRTRHGTLLSRKVLVTFNTGTDEKEDWIMDAGIERIEHVIQRVW
jgi:hypothetical protein